MLKLQYGRDHFQSFFIYVLWQSMPAIQTYNYKIRSYHTDASGKLFVHQLLNFFQDAAHNHADGAGFGQQQLTSQNLYWVLSRLTIEILSLPQHGDEIVISTWVKSVRGAISAREFSLVCTGEVLVKASSLWFCVSGTSRKPSLLPLAYSSLMQIEDRYATKTGTEKISGRSEQTGDNNGVMVKAGYSDIDMVDHVNNATYGRWLMDELSAVFHQHKKLRKLTLNYLGECLLGEEVCVSHESVAAGKVAHKIANMATGDVICRAISCWE